jgi:hypothetical protein
VVHASIDPPASRAPAAPAAHHQAPSAAPSGHHQAPSAPSGHHQASAGEVHAIRRYFAQLDAAMAGTESLGDPNGFATELLQQSLQGDSSGFTALLASAQACLRAVQAIKAPPSCAEHQKLTLRQLKQAIAILGKVQGATTSMDTSSLQALASQGKGLQVEAARLARLDEKLRGEIR